MQYFSSILLSDQRIVIHDLHWNTLKLLPSLMPSSLHNLFGVCGFLLGRIWLFCEKIADFWRAPSQKHSSNVPDILQINTWYNLITYPWFYTWFLHAHECSFSDISKTKKNLKSWTRFLSQIQSIIHLPKIRYAFPRHIFH